MPRTLRYFRRLAAIGVFTTDVPVEAVDRIDPESGDGSGGRTLARLLTALGLLVAAAALLRRAADQADGGDVEPPF